MYQRDGSSDGYLLGEEIVDHVVVGEVSRGHAAEDFIEKDATENAKVVCFSPPWGVLFPWYILTLRV